MRVLVSNAFKRAAKKLHQKQKTMVEEAIQIIKKNPDLGELKVGDLAGIRVYKFRILHQLILLSYLYNESKNELILVSFGPHENFYENLKNHIKENFH